jgi:hypothetical protein
VGAARPLADLRDQPGPQRLHPRQPHPRLHPVRRALR